jgi:hypothetical protein
MDSSEILKPLSGPTMSVPEAGSLLGLSRNKAYEAAKSGPPSVIVPGTSSRRQTGGFTPRSVTFNQPFERRRLGFQNVEQAGQRHELFRPCLGCHDAAGKVAGMPEADISQVSQKATLNGKAFVDR